MNEVMVPTCAWCDKRIAPNVEVFSLGAKARKGIDLKPYEGSSIMIPLTCVKKDVKAFIPISGSQARRAGTDLVFAPL